MPQYSARQKIDEDLQDLDRQIKLQAGEPLPVSEDRPAKAFMTTAMVCNVTRPLSVVMFLIESFTAASQHSLRACFLHFVGA